MGPTEAIGRAWDGLVFSSRLPGGSRLALRFAGSHFLGVGCARDVTVRTPRRSLMTQPTYALSALFEVFGANLYNLPGNLGEAPVVLDIGGHVGAFTVAICEAYPSARCVVFEPAPDTYSYLSRNIGQNGLLKRVKAEEAAVAGEEGFASMDLSTPVASGHRSIATTGGTRKSARVRVRAFADVVREIGAPIDLLKLDCEGSEYAIVEQTSPSDWASVRRVVMEYHPDDPERFHALARRLHSFGFNLVGQWRWKYSHDLLGMLWWARPGFEQDLQPATIAGGTPHLPLSVLPVTPHLPTTVEPEPAVAELIGVAARVPSTVEPEPTGAELSGVA